MNLSDYTFDELVKLKNEIENYLYSESDGFLYLCKVRSYGRNWTERLSNSYVVSELCNRYDGDDGIVDVYTTNPDLKIYNYGQTYYIKSEEDYNTWFNWNYIKNQIPKMEEELKEWNNRDNVPFNRRPYFSPIFTQETIDRYKEELDEYDMNFVAPVSISRIPLDEEE